VLSLHKIYAIYLLFLYGNSQRNRRILPIKDTKSYMLYDNI